MPAAQCRTRQTLNSDHCPFMLSTSSSILPAAVSILKRPQFGSLKWPPVAGSGGQFDEPTAAGRAVAESCHRRLALHNEMNAIRAAGCSWPRPAWLTWHVAQHLPDLWLKAHVKHAVSFIKHQHGHLPAAAMVNGTAAAASAAEAQQASKTISSGSGVQEQATGPRSSLLTKGSALLTGCCPSLLL